jgi:hypothetical protein
MAMRAVVVILALVAVTLLFTTNSARQGKAFVGQPGSHHQPISFSETLPLIDFSTQIKPIFEARCQPCHFTGGKVYDKMPFDRAETIKKLGTKLFTRIKDEREQQLIREFLTQN